MNQGPIVLDNVQTQSDLGLDKALYGNKPKATWALAMPSSAASGSFMGTVGAEFVFPLSLYKLKPLSAALHENPARC